VAKCVRFIEWFTWRIYGTRKQKEIHVEAETEASKIERGYTKRGVSSKEAERRAWATVNKSDKGGRKKGGVAGKSGANQARAKVGEKAVGNESLIIAKTIASAAINI